ncbi:MAG: hypothetical protein GY869_00870, partial [Planctomycetes bacterium]|nr:hypothetical protein [Planctomycetota bacterium]
MRKLTCMLLMITMCLVTSQQVHAQVGTAFIYQGKLNDGGIPADGKYDFGFSLFSTESAGGFITDIPIIEDVAVYNGHFTVTIDFGDEFNGDSRWIAIYVRPGDSTGFFTPLSPRQPIAPN